ncbi:hypothetical protein ACQJBY_065491 [Aegilops geniculata]
MVSRRLRSWQRRGTSGWATRRTSAPRWSMLAGVLRRGTGLFSTTAAVNTSPSPYCSSLTCNGLQASKGRDIGSGQTSTGAWLSWNGTNPYDGILNLKPPDFTTLLTTMYGEGYWSEVVGCHGSIAHLQDASFAPLLHFMNSLELHNVEDDPYNEINMLLKEDLGQNNGRHACATDEDLAMEFLVRDSE